MERGNILARHPRREGSRIRFDEAGSSWGTDPNERYHDLNKISDGRGFKERNDHTESNLKVGVRDANEN